MTLDSRNIPTTVVDFRAEGFAADPYPALEAVRRLGPVVYDEGLDQFLITGWRDIARIYGNVDRFASDYDHFVGLFGGATMECMEKERHDPVRSIWAEAFRRQDLEKQRDMITEVITSRLEPFVEKVRSGATVDAVAEMTRGIPTLVIAHMLGIPPADYEQFGAWSDAMAAVPEGEADRSPRGAELVRRGAEATAALNRYVADVLEERRRRPGSDLISMMAVAPFAKEMEESEITASNTQLVFAGNETTAKLMANTLNALAAHPDQRRELAADRSLIPAAVEEIHRWNSIVHAGRRIVRNGGASVAGIELHDGETVMCLQGVANRDPDRWDRPGQLDIHRPPKQHLGFGFGMHSCLGLNLARLEVHIWLDLLLDKLPEWGIESVDWGSNWVLRGPIRLDVSK
ncbi:cytochrome P450 [Nocardioides sp. J9]|uniref:cytochrome P450 n=1 Tax=Nocardioides sp. J9 TaxID=935844 RepID=UPI0011A3AC2A|nr:cytochrome P450 [Nocardioides sp. J9]TWG98567.1 cytochrome P450 [Nocardioides sp. J9]